MGIYFGNHFGREPFQFDSVGNHWEQESVARPDGYPRYHYLQTESGCGIVSVKGEDILLDHRVRNVYRHDGTVFEIDHRKRGLALDQRGER